MRLVRRGIVGKGCFIECDMTRDEDASCLKIKAAVATVSGGIAEEETMDGTRGKFIFDGGSYVNIAKASKNTEVIVAWMETKKREVGCDIVFSCCGTDVD